MPYKQEIRDQLVKRLTRLTKRAGQISANLRKPGSADWQERAVEIENDEVLEGLDVSTQAEVLQIQEALKRIDDGEYGTCSGCEKPIPPKRLKAMPHTTVCVGCAEAG